MGGFTYLRKHACVYASEPLSGPDRLNNPAIATAVKATFYLDLDFGLVEMVGNKIRDVCSVASALFVTSFSTKPLAPHISHKSHTAAVFPIETAEMTGSQPLHKTR